MSEFFMIKLDAEKVIHYVLQAIMTAAITVSVGYIRSIAETIHKLEINMVIMAEKQLSHQKSTENHEQRLQKVESIVIPIKPILLQKKEIIND
jgi:uncharacterized protein YdgA (DUF945 family)